MFHHGNNHRTLESKVETTTWPFWAFHITELNIKEGDTFLAKVIEEIRLLLHNVDRKDYIWNLVDYLGYLLVCSYLIVKINGKL